MPKSISKYDDWKTSLPDEPEPIAFCDSCGAELYEGDYLYTINGEKLCEGFTRTEAIGIVLKMATAQ